MSESRESAEPIPDSTNRWLAGLLKLLLLAAPLCACFFFPPVLTVSSPQSWGGSDLRYFLTIYGAFWNGEISNPYAYDQISRVLADHFGYLGAKVMPVGQSPSALLLFFPLLQIERLAPHLVERIFNWSGALLMSGVLALLLRRVKLHKMVSALSALLCCALIILTCPGWFAFGFAQLSPFATSLILLLILLGRSRHSAASILGGVLLPLLSCKLPHFLIGMLVLLAARNRLLLISSAMFLAALAAALLLFVQGELWTQWVNTLSFFLHADAQRFMTSGVVWSFTSNSNLRVLLDQLLGLPLAWRIASALYAPANIILFAILLRGWIRQEVNADRYFQYVYLALCAYLVLCPYVPVYDQLLLIPAVFCALQQRQCLNGLSFSAGCLALGSAAALYQRLSGSPWICGALIVWGLLALGNQSQTRPGLSQQS